MLDFPAYFPYFSSSGFTIFFWATICWRNWKITSRCWISTELKEEINIFYTQVSHLTECALHPTQEVIIASADAVGPVNVVDLEA